MKIESNRRSSFGMKCIRCDDELIAPERSEYRDQRQVRHLWHCWECDFCFESVVSFPADTKSIERIMRRIEDILTRRYHGKARYFGVFVGRLEQFRRSSDFPQSDANSYAELCSFAERPLNRRSTHRDCCQHPGQSPRP